MSRSFEFFFGFSLSLSENPQLNPDAAVPAAMTERRAAVLAQLKALKERCLPLLQVGAVEIARVVVAVQF